MDMISYFHVFFNNQMRRNDWKQEPLMTFPVPSVPICRNRSKNGIWYPA